MNLAAFRYRNSMHDDGGPIADLRVREYIDGGYEAFADLSSSLQPNWLSPRVIYGKADGHGTALSKTEACYKAISEAIERWAFYETARSSKASQFGFDVDCSTCGMAAFPGFTSRGAKLRAFLEAVERWTIAAWWEGRLRGKVVESNRSNVACIEISSPWPNVKTVILHEEADQHCYAFGSGFSTRVAIARAEIELKRNVASLRSFLEKSIERREVASDVYERRLLYFATEAGFANFMERRAASMKIASNLSVPFVLTNRSIHGVWSKYATVWRVLFQPVSQEQFSEAPTYFLF